MKPLPVEEIIRFLESNIEPIPDATLGAGYRAAVTLTDGLHLPCVLFRDAAKITGLAMRRFDEERSGKTVFSKESGLGYSYIVKSFVAGGNCINHYDIAEIRSSDFAFPMQTINKIHGETRMAWTGFVAKMKDGKQFAFGTPFSFLFFAMPEGYTPGDIAEIMNHAYLDKDGNIKSYHARDWLAQYEQNRGPIFKDRPFFECYLDHLE
jgi:hypothetical protein